MLTEKKFNQGVVGQPLVEWYQVFSSQIGGQLSILCAYLFLWKTVILDSYGK